MPITIQYFGQLRQLAGTEQETVAELPPDLTSCLAAAAEQYPPKFRDIIFDDRGQLRPSVMILVNDQPIDKAEPPPLQDGDAISLLAAIAGG